MPVSRFFIADLSHKQVTLEGSEHRHLAQTLRGKTGDTIELVDGNGALSTGSIINSSRKETLIEILSTEISKAPESISRLLLGLPKVSNLELVVEKGTELGISEFLLFTSRNSPKTPLSNSKLERLHSILISALKQCGRLYLPKITLLTSLDEYDMKGKLYFGDLDPEATQPHEAFSGNSKTVAIGPEPGFTSSEIATLESLGAIGISFGKNILRAETASIAAATLLNL